MKNVSSIDTQLDPQGVRLIEIHQVLNFVLSYYNRSALYVFFSSFFAKVMSEVSLLGLMLVYTAIELRLRMVTK